MKAQHSGKVKFAFLPYKRCRMHMGRIICVLLIKLLLIQAEIRLWEQINNTDFNLVEFDQIKTEYGKNSFAMSPTQWIKRTNAIGIVAKGGRYSIGTYAHPDIAFEFASWLSPEFKLYLITEFGLQMKVIYVIIRIYCI